MGIQECLSTLLVKCKFHHLIITYIIIINILSHSDDNNLLVTVVTEEGFPPEGVGRALSDQITATGAAAGIVVNVQVTRFGERSNYNMLDLAKYIYTTLFL